MEQNELYNKWRNAIEKESYNFAEKIYQKLQEQYPETKKINYPMGVWYEEQEQYLKGEKAFKKALVTDPDICSDIFFHLGNIYRKRNMNKEALIYYRKALDYDNEFFEALYNIGKVLASLNKSNDALQAFRSAHKLNPEDLETHINIGVELSNLGKRKDAIDIYQKALKIHPDSYMLYSNLGIEFADMGQFEKAEEFHKRALELNAFYANGWYNLACTYSLAKKKELALKALEKAIRLDQENLAYAQKDPDLKNLQEFEPFLQLIKGKNS